MEAARSFRNVGKHLPYYTVSQLSKQQSSEDYEFADMHLLDNCYSGRKSEELVFEIGTAVLLSSRHDPLPSRFQLALTGTHRLLPPAQDFSRGSVEGWRTRVLL